MHAAIACPNCKTPMERHRFAGRVHGEVELDVCWECRVIWFDQFESAQLAPASVIGLFKLIHDHRDRPHRALADLQDCPRCQTLLALTHDMQRHNRLRYHRCPFGHGRLTAFMQFLREKEFVRTLSVSEVQQLKATVAQVRCSSCGATIDLARDVACSYCRAPLAVLDAESVEKALAALSRSEDERTESTPSDTAKAFESLLAAYRAPQQEHVWLQDVTSLAAFTRKSSHGVVDLFAAGLGQLFTR